MFLTFVLFVFAFRFSVSVSVSRSLGLKRRTRNNDTNINHNHNFSLFAQRADFLLLLLLLARVRAEARLSCKARLNLAKTAIHIISSEQTNSTRLEIRNPKPRHVEAEPGRIEKGFSFCSNWTSWSGQAPAKRKSLSIVSLSSSLVSNLGHGLRTFKSQVSSHIRMILFE